MAGKLFLIGVGPGSSKYLTDIAKQKIIESHYIIGYSYTLSTIRHLLDSRWQKICEVSMNTQDDIYKNVFNRMEVNECCTVPFTGDVNFSESEVVNRLLEIFGEDNVELIPGISSIQVAASKAKIPLDKAAVFTFHITDEIDERKTELLDAVRNKRSVILLPRPWPKNREKEFIESDIAFFLKNNMIQTDNLDVWIFEFLTKQDERIFRGKVSDLEEQHFDSLSVMVIDQAERKTYLDFE